MHGEHTHGEVVDFPDRPGRFLTKKQVASALGRSTRWVELRLAEGLPADRTPAGKARFDLVEVRAWLEAEDVPRSPVEPIICRPPITYPGTPVGVAAMKYGLEWREPAVYFVQSGDGPVKIGFCSRASLLEDRMRALQIGNPDELRLLGLVRAPDGVVTEARLHKRFVESRLRGEWFTLSTQIQAYLDAMVRDSSGAATGGYLVLSQSSDLGCKTSPLITSSPQFLAFGAAQRVLDPLDCEGPRTVSPLCAGVLAHVGSRLRNSCSLFGLPAPQWRTR